MFENQFELIYKEQLTNAVYSLTLMNLLKKIRWKQFYCIWKLWQMVAHEQMYVFQARPVHAGSCVVTRSFGWSR